MCQLTQVFLVSDPVQLAFQEPLCQPAAMIHSQTEQLLPQSALPGTEQRFLRGPSLAFYILDNRGERGLGTEYTTRFKDRPLLQGHLSTTVK